VASPRRRNENQLSKIELIISRSAAYTRCVAHVPFRRRLQKLVRERIGSKFDIFDVGRAQMAPMLVGECVVREHAFGVIVGILSLTVVERRFAVNVAGGTSCLVLHAAAFQQPGFTRR